MEIKKFEAYTYRGPALMSVKKRDVIDAISDIITGEKMFGYDIDGTSTFDQKEELLLHLNKEVNGKYFNKTIKLDVSDMGIEIGDAIYDEDGEFIEFIPELNLDTDVTKQIKNLKKDMNKYNII